MKKEKELDDLFRDKLRNFEQAPPAYILDNVLAGVASAKRKRKLYYWRIASVAAALLLAFVAGWQFNANNGDQLQQIVVAQNNAAENTIEKQVQNASDVIQAASASVVSPGASLQAETIQNVLVGRTSKSVKPLASSDNRRVESPEHEALLKPLKTLYSLIEQDLAYTKQLQERKSGVSTAELAEKTIDQQIMEQNSHALLALNETPKKSKWMVGAHVSPGYSVNKSSHSRLYANNMLNSSTNSPAELGGGVSVEYKRGKRWSIQSGVYYSGLGQSSGNKSNVGNQDVLYNTAASGYFNTPVNIDTKSSRMSVNSSAGVIELSNIPTGIVVGSNFEEKTLNSAVVVSNAEFIQNFEYLEIPLYLRYTLIDARFDVIMLGGFSSNVLVGNQIFVDAGSGRSLVGKTKDMEALNYSGTLGFGLKYDLSKRISLNVEPRVKYFLNSLNSNSSVSYKPYTVGIFTGLSYEF